MTLPDRFRRANWLLLILALVLTAVGVVVTPCVTSSVCVVPDTSMRAPGLVTT